MTKKERLTLYIIGPIIGVLFILVLVLNAFAQKKAEQIVYPEGKLSDSIFDSQNTKYVASEFFDGEHEFTKVPYKADTFGAAGAIVGNGTVYAQGDFYVYYTEINKTGTVNDVLRTEFSQVVKYGAEPEMCSVDKIRSEEGFKNGYNVVYEISQLSVATGNSAAKKAYILSYRLEINDGDKIKDNTDIVLAVATNTLSTNSLAKCKQVLDASIMTVQYSKTMAADIEKAINNGTFDGILEESNNQTGNSDNGNSTAGGNANNGGISSTESTESGSAGSTLTNDNGAVNTEAKTMGILLKQDYKDLVLYVDWTNLEASPKLTFSDVREEVTYKPTTYDEGRAVFTIGEISAGVYMVTITGWEDAGTFTSSLLEN